MSDDLVKRLRDCANGFGNFKNDLGDFGLCDTAAARIEELEAKLAAMSQGKEHFKRAAEKQNQRCHKLRHRQRALMFALKNVKNCTSLDAAKFVACIAIGGWEDDEFVYKSRTTLAELTGGKDE